MLKVKYVTKRFAGLVAVKELSFEVSEGQILAIIGPNGAGKVHSLQPDHRYPAPHCG